MSQSPRFVGFISLLIVSATEAGVARGEVESVAGNGFEVRESIHVSASPAKAYAALLTPSKWWSSRHTFSKDAANLTLDARAGGCWCESIPQSGGSAEHLRVVAVIPGKLLRLRGALGPLQSMGLDGALSFTLTSANTGTDITIDYAVGGYSKGGFAQLSKPVDQVLSEQLASLKRLIER